MAKGVPITLFGKEVGRAYLEPNGELHGDINDEILTPDERSLIFGEFRSMDFSIERT